MTLLRRWRLAAGALLLVLVSFSGGVWADQRFPDLIPIIGPNQQRGQLDQASLDQAVRIVRADYYDPNLDATKLSQGTIRGLVQSLNDPYSAYLSPQQYRDEQNGYAGAHSGMIGIYVAFQGGHPVVSGILPGSPALAAGLKTDDVILDVGGKDTANLSSDQVSALIRGPVGTGVVLHVRRADAELDVAVTRSDFKSPTVESFRFPDGVLYMRIYEFGDSTEQEFDSKLEAGLPGSRALILDLRGNGGGLVSAATAVISRFVAGGEAFSERGRDGKGKVTNVDGDHPAAGVALAVLVNHDTASAAEIVSGSLQAHGRTRLIGAKTFGKGSVQVDYQLSDGGDLHLTIEHWFLPDGRSINGVGIAPDQVVPLADPAEMFDVVQPERGHAGDAQLNAALQQLR